MKQYELCSGAQLRLCILMTHYRSQLPYSKKRMEEAKVILDKWLKVCEPCEDPCPVEVLEEFCNDLNTPQIVAILHRYRKNKKGKELFSALRFLGFFGEIQGPSEYKMLPNGHTDAVTYAKNISG